MLFYLKSVIVLLVAVIVLLVASCCSTCSQLLSYLSVVGLLFPVVVLLVDRLVGAPEGSRPPRGGGGTGGESIEPLNQHRTVRLAQVSST